MKNRVRQLLSVVLTACMLVTMVPLTAYGADVDFQDDVSASVELFQIMIRLLLLSLRIQLLFH